MLLLTGGFRLVVVVAVVAIALGPRPASAAEDVAKAVEKQVGEQVRVITHDALGFPKKIRGTRADTRYEADFDDVFEDMARTGKWPLNTDKVMNQVDVFYSRRCCRSRFCFWRCLSSSYTITVSYPTLTISSFLIVFEYLTKYANNFKRTVIIIRFRNYRKFLYARS